MAAIERSTVGAEVTRARARRALAAIATCVVLMTGLAPGVARAETPPLPFGNGFGEIVVDPVLGRVFFSSPAAGLVTVVEPNGDVVRRLVIQGEAGSLLVDGNRLYVTRNFPAGIEVFDTGTLDRVATLGEGRLDSPYRVVMAGGRLWTRGGSCVGGSTLASIDPATDDVRTFGASGLAGCINLVGSPADPNLLMGWDGSFPPKIIRFDVSGGSPTVVAGGVLEGHQNVAQIAFNPGGQTFVVAAYSPFKTTQFRTADLMPEVLTYPSGPYNVSVATTANNGERMAVVGGNGIEVFPVNEPSRVVFAHSFPEGPQQPARSGLAWSPTGLTLYAVTISLSHESGLLHTFAVPGSLKAQTTTVLETSSPAAVYGEKFTITATVSAQGAGAPVPTGTVSFFNGSNFISKVTIRNGQAKLGPRTMPLGTNSVTATYNGNTANEPSTSAPLMQVVNRARTVTSLTSSPNPSAPQEAVTLRATVAVVAPGAGVAAEKVSFYDGPRLIGTARITEGQAVLTTSSLPAGSRSLTATYVGSARFEPSTSVAVAHLVEAPAPG